MTRPLSFYWLSVLWLAGAVAFFGAAYFGLPHASLERIWPL